MRTAVVQSNPSTLFHTRNQTENRLRWQHRCTAGSALLKSWPVFVRANHLLSAPWEVPRDKGSLRSSWVHQERSCERVLEDALSLFFFLGNIRAYLWRNSHVKYLSGPWSCFENALIFLKTMFLNFSVCVEKSPGKSVSNAESWALA